MTQTPGEMLAMVVPAASNPVKWDGRSRRHTPDEQVALGLKAWELAAQGKSLRAIGAELGIDKNTAGRYKSLVLSRVEAPMVEEIRATQLEQIEELLSVWMPKALAGDAKAAVIVLKAQERQSKLTGADKPTQHTTTTVVEVSPQQTELMALIQETQESNTIEGEVVDG
jgi:hypothetical protein